jgi:hypothetical protein
MALTSSVVFYLDNPGILEGVGCVQFFTTKKNTRLIGYSIVNQSGVPILILNHIVRISNAVPKRIIGPCSA